MTTRQLQEKSRIAKLMAQAVDPDGFESEAEIAAHAVYRVNSDTGSGSYRFGLHPDRQGELERQFDKVEIVALFRDEEIAKTISAYLNGAW